MPALRRGVDSRTKLQEFVARVAKMVKAPVRKTGHREFESHRVLLMRRGLPELVLSAEQN